MMRVKTPTVYQMEATECGAASLAMVLAHWGCYIPLEQLRIDTGVSRDGCNAMNLLRGARKYGLEAHGYRKELEGLYKLEMPCIIHWNFNHFVVLEGIKGKYAYLNDPACGRRKITYEELDDGFTGVVLTFKKTIDFKRTVKPNNLLLLALDRLKTQKTNLFVLVLLGLILVIPGLILPVLTQLYMDRVLVANNVTWATELLFGLTMVALLQAILRLYRSFIQEKLNQKVSLISAHQFFSRLFQLPMNFYDQRALGDLVNRSDNNERVNSFLTGDLSQVCLDAITAFFYLLLLIKYSMLLTIIGVAGVSISLVIAYTSAGIVQPLVEKQQVDNGKFNGIVYSGISILETLKASGIENEYCSRILGQQAKSASNQQKATWVQSVITALSEIINVIFSIIMLITGGLLVINGRLTTGMLVAFISLFQSFSSPVQTVVSFIQSIQTMKADMGRVDDVLKYPVDESNLSKKAVKMSGKLKGNIEIKDITFGYSKLNRPLIQHLTLHISAGTSIAIVGASGSGKSTIGKIVSGLYTPWEGEMYFDGTERSSIPLNVINSSIATVSQEVILYSGTIRENLSMWNDNILEEDLIQAAKDACIHDVITAKPGAYDYRLMEGADNMSGGQRQRIEIARALATNPSILVLDEATSALDPETEKMIVENIKKRGCTCIVIAHRLSAIRDCDEIVVLDKGMVVEKGTHEQLIQNHGYYATLVENM